MKYENLIKQMTLEEKASLMSGKDFWQSKNIDRLDIPSIFLSDGPHGLRKQAAAADHLGLNASIPATCFPTAVTMANSWNPELGERLGKALGEEAVSMDVSVVLGPGMNIKRNPRCGRCFEYFSEDPYLAGKMASGYVKGIQENGIAACVKHYACNSQEERRMTLDSVLDERTLREIYLTGFEIAVKEGKTKTIMSSYNLINGVYANENYHTLVEILRNEWGFDGFVVTDWGGNNDRIEAIKALNSLEMPSTGGETDRDIVEAVKNGKLDEKTLDECVDLMLQLIFETRDAFKDNKKEFDVEGHHALAKECALDGIVLLKNKDNVLPLKEKTKVAVIGDFAKTPRYQGAGSSIVNPTKLDNTLEVIKDYDLEFVGYAQGFDRYGKKSKGKINEAKELLNKADVGLLYLGLDEITEAEGLDRKNIRIPENQVALVNELAKLGKKLVVILSCGSVVEVSWISDKVDGLLHTYLTGQAGASAILDILTGKVSPSGRLSETIPYSYKDVGTYNYFPAKALTAEYREGLYVGYRYYDTNNVKVEYPFGYGLSYTTFEYSDLKVDDKGVSFKITNTGDMKAKDVAQLYVSLPESKIFRAKKELKGFKKVELEPKETKEVRIDFDEYTFRFFNVKTNKFEVEGGKYLIQVGRSVEDIVLSDSLEVKGNATEFAYDKEKMPHYFSGDVANVDDLEFKELLGREIPNGNYNFYKKNRMVIHYNTTVEELRYSKRWVGRAFSGAIRFAIWLLRKIGQRSLANTLIMGVLNQPMRGLSRMTGGAISWGQLDGLIMMFNGHFWKGLSHFMKEGKKKKKLAKETKAKEEASKKDVEKKK